MARPTKQQQQANTRKSARATRAKEKGVYLRAVKDGVGVYDVSETVNGKRVSRRVQIAMTASNAEYSATIERIKSAIRAENNATERRPFESIVDEYCTKRGVKESTAEKIRLYLSPYGYDDAENKKAFDALLNGDLKAGTKRIRIKAIRALFAYAKENVGGFNTPDPTAGVKPPQGKARTRIPTDAEVSALLASMDYRPDILFTRLLIYTGARCSTIEALRPCDMTDDWKLALYNVKCDRRYSVKIPVTDTLIQKLWAGITECMKTDQRIFDAGTRRRIQARMYRMFPKDADGETISPHSFRHLRTTRLIQAATPLPVVAKLLDASPTVLLRTYTTITQADIDNLFLNE